MISPIIILISPHCDNVCFRPGRSHSSCQHPTCQPESMTSGAKWTPAPVLVHLGPVPMMVMVFAMWSCQKTWVSLSCCIELYCRRIAQCFREMTERWRHQYRTMFSMYYIGPSVLCIVTVIIRITSWKSVEETSSVKLGDAFEKALEDVKELFSSWRECRQRKYRWTNMSTYDEQKLLPKVVSFQIVGYKEWLYFQIFFPKHFIRFHTTLTPIST